MRYLSHLLTIIATSLIVSCQRDNQTHLPQQTATAANPPNTAPPSMPTTPKESEEPYTPQEIAWQDIRLGMSKQEYLKCIRPKISGDPKDTWADDGTIQTIDGRPHIRIELHDYDAKQDRVLDSGVPDNLFGELPSYRTFLTDEPVTHLDYLETYDTPNKSELLQGAEATFANDRLIILCLDMKPNIVSKDEAIKKFEQKYQKRFEAIQIKTYRRPDTLIISAINCLVLRKNRCTIDINEGSTEFPKSGYYIQLQDDYRVKEMIDKSNIMITKLQQKVKASKKAKSDSIQF